MSNPKLSDVEKKQRILRRLEKDALHDINIVTVQKVNDTIDALEDIAEFRDFMKRFAGILLAKIDRLEEV